MEASLKCASLNHLILMPQNVPDYKLVWKFGMNVLHLKKKIKSIIHLQGQNKTQWQAAFSLNSTE